MDGGNKIDGRIIRWSRLPFLVPVDRTNSLGASVFICCPALGNPTAATNTNVFEAFFLLSYCTSDALSLPQRFPSGVAINRN